MKTLLLTLTYTVGIGELILAIYFWVTNSKNEIRRVMAFVAFFASMWVITSALSSYVNPTPFVMLMLSFVYVFGVLLVTSLLNFVIIFPHPSFQFDKLHRVLLYVPALVFSYIAVFTRTIINELVVTPDTPGSLISGPLHNLYNYYILIIFIIIFLLLIQKSRTTDGETRKLVLAVLVSILIGAIFPIWFDLLVPSFFPQFESMNYLFGNIGTALWLGMTTYIVRK